eukprot:3680727-Pyramimonas_sp.AAC.1
MVAVCDHGEKTAFGDKGEEFPRRWQEMVATLRDDDIREVVGGPHGSGALVGCSLEIRPNSYDHKRRSVLRAAQFAGQRVKVKLPMWDFALHRDDGTAV